MISEEEVTFTQPAAVKGQAPGTLPAAVTKEAAATQLAYRIAKACFTQSAGGIKVKPSSTSTALEMEFQPDLTLKDGDRVEAKGQVVDVKSFDPNSLDTMKRIMGPEAFQRMSESGYAVYDFSSLTINGQAYKGYATYADGALRAKGVSLDQLNVILGKQSALLPEDSRMAVYASFTVPNGFSALVDGALEDMEVENLKNPPGPAFSSIRKLLRTAVLPGITIQ